MNALSSAKKLQHGFGSELGHAPTAAAEALLHKIGAILRKWCGQIADDVWSQPRSSAVEIDDQIVRGDLQSVVHRAAFAEYGAGDHASSGSASQQGGVVK